MKFIQARHYQPGRRKPIRLLVIHDMEAPEGPLTAENVAAYFAAADTRVASAHYCIDNNTVVQCVQDGDTAYAAKGANADGLHFELAGYARQTPDEWVDAYSLSMLHLAAALVAFKAKQYGIPIRRLSPREVQDGKAGICGHGDVTAAYPPGTGHTDPGASFPWNGFLDLVHQSARDVPDPPPEDDVSPEDIEKVAQRVVELLKPVVATHQDMVVLLRGTADGKHPNNLTSIGKAVGVKQ